MPIVPRPDPPSPFVEQWATTLAPRLVPPRRVLDIATGRGRHALVFAAHGCQAFGVDISLEAVQTAARAAASHGLAVRLWCADLTAFTLPRSRFEAVVVTRYLQRDLF